MAAGRCGAETLEPDDAKIPGGSTVTTQLGCSQKVCFGEPGPGKLVKAKRELPFTARRSGVLIRCESVKLLLPGKNLSSLLLPAFCPGIKDCLND